MGKPHPLAEQCTATSKATGQRCRIRVIGGGPCRVHGGAAPQVARAREARIIAAEAARDLPVTAADAADVLTSAMNDAHSLLQRIKQNIADGRFSEADMRVLGDWVDRVARISKLVVDSGVQERRFELEAAQARMVVATFERALARSNFTDAQKHEFKVIAAEEFLAIEGPGEQVERRAIEGQPW